MLGFCVCSMFGIQPAYSLGLGEVQLDSYIGQELSASIPVLSVADSSSMLVEITPLNNVVLASQIQNLNGQTLIRITSQQSINEPYIQFNLKVTDQAQVIVREFTALVDIKPEVSPTPFYSDQQYQQQVRPTNLTESSNPSDTLGPYEWAQPGNIPSRFGPVLDGQSLWRVARRINSAMGVTIDQMMWALFINNPDAFANSTIESLLAGTYLNIPEAYLLSNVSDTQAKENLNKMSTNTITFNDVAEEIKTVSTDEVDVRTEELVSTNDAEDSASAQTDDLMTESSNLVADEFKLSGLNEIAGLDENDAPNPNPQTIETINVLSVTVGNLTQELIRKDKRIEFLEEKIIALERVATLDSNPVDLSVTETITPTIVGAVTNVVNPVTISNEGSSSWLNRWWLWAAAILISLVALAFFIRKFLALNLFGRVDDIDFPTQMEAASLPNKGLESSQYPKLSVTDNAQPYVDDVVDELASNKDVSDDDIIENYSDYAEISVHYYDDADTVSVSEKPEKSNEQDVADFEIKLESLKKKENYPAISELLETARNVVIDDDRYYFERLQFYFQKKDEDEFYAFYDEIEYAIQHFPEDWNRQISEMVIELGQTA